MKQEIAKLKSKLKEPGISIKQDKKIFSVHQDTKKVFDIAYYNGFDTIIRNGLYAQVDSGFPETIILTTYAPHRKYRLEFGDNGYQELLELYKVVQKQTNTKVDKTVKQSLQYEQYTATKQKIYEYCCQVHGMQTEA